MADKKDNDAKAASPSLESEALDEFEESPAESFYVEPIEPGAPIDEKKFVYALIGLVGLAAIGAVVFAMSR